MNDRPNMGGLSRKHIQQACEASLKRLGVETIDLYQIHRLDRHTPIAETLAALDQLVTQGKVRYIGASSMYAWQLMKALSISDARGFARFVTMQNHYNLIYREEEREMLPLCAAEGLATIPWSPLARGMLAGTRAALGDSSTTRSETDRLDQILYDQPSDWDVVDAVKKVASERSVAPARVALAWLLHNPVVAAPIVGATKLAHLDDAIAATDLELEASEIAALEAPYAPHPVKGLEPPGPAGGLRVAHAPGSSTTGIRSIPLKWVERWRTTSPATSKRGNRARSSPHTTCASSRARLAPRQKCSP
jgi:aryl-alcohol dehydrogenase-like predicted oxidoreductase